jgi:hypothetical protein
MAAALAARRNADALTVGDEIVLADAHGETTPSTLGVLAHELTHVARVREPRFVPPIVRDAGEPTSRPAVQPQLPHAAAPQSAGADDEALALRVEGAVRRAARSDAARGVDAPRLIPESVEPSPRPSRRGPGTVEQRFTGEPVGPSESVPSTGIGGDDHDVSPWGGLPAPWEPLPEALTRMTASPTNGVGAAVESSVAVGPALAASPAIAPAAPAPVQAAARDRTLAEQPASGTAASSGGHATGASPAPNIDALARQVYDVLKRRLAAEKRRGG